MTNELSPTNLTFMKGRKPIKPEHRHRNVIQARLTDKQYKSITAQADNQNLTVSELVRRITIDYCKE